MATTGYQHCLFSGKDWGYYVQLTYSAGNGGITVSSIQTYQDSTCHSYSAYYGNYQYAQLTINGTTQELYGIFAYNSTSAKTVWSGSATGSGEGSIGVSLSFRGRSSSPYTITASWNINVGYGYGTVDVNPQINGTAYNGGLDGFTFSVNNSGTYTDYYDSRAALGGYTATPYAKTGYTTSSSSGTLTDGGSLALTPSWRVKSHTVSLTKGTGISSVSGGGTYNYGDSVSISASVSTGYSWSGWTGDVTSSNRSHSFTLGDKNYSITANATANTYTNYCQCWTWGYRNGEGNNGGKTAFHIGDTSWTAKYGASAQWTAARAKSTPNGFTMRNKIGSSSHSGSWTEYNLPYSFTQPAGSCYAEYDYDPVSYSITYTMNGGTNSSSNPSSYNVLYGVTFANPTRSGYDFRGWTIGGTSVTGINPGANASFSSPDDLYNKCASRTTGNKTVVANWRETKPSNVRITSATATSPFTISLAWNATGVNISNYTVYYKAEGASSYQSQSFGTAKSGVINVAEETTYTIYIAATNPGGTTNNSSSPTTCTTPADQAKIRRKVNGSWVKGKTYYKKDGAWVKAKKVYIKINNEWKVGNNYDPE